MSSIAYITDHDMIEYHRLNGNHLINFWKPSNLKKINDFKQGDFLFFLVKGTEKGLEKEKGILGYGKLMSSCTCTFNQMWERYDTKNGYANKALLKEAIKKVTKNHKIPSYLTCFILSEITFFQGPIYLSEIGLQISNKIESYIYLDKRELTNTAKVLEKANGIGIDTWSNLFQNKDDEVFMEDARFNFISNIIQKMNIKRYSKHDEKRIYLFLNKQIRDKKYKMIGKTVLLHEEKDMLNVYLPCLINTTEFMEKLQFCIGCYSMISGYIHLNGYAESINVILLFNRDVEDELKAILDNKAINYVEADETI